MFKMVETHRSTEAFTPSYPGQKAPGKVVFRDRESGITVTHFHTHRGGSLYAEGHVIVLNRDNGQHHVYNTTRPPIDAETAARLAWRVRDRVGYIAPALRRGRTCFPFKEK